MRKACQAYSSKMRVCISVKSTSAQTALLPLPPPQQRSPVHLEMPLFIVNSLVKSTDRKGNTKNAQKKFDEASHLEINVVSM